MPQQIFYANQGLEDVVSAVGTALANGKIRLFKSGFSPNITTTVADLEEHEANYTGYAAGGLDVVGWAGPFLAPEGGMAIQTVSFTFSTGAPVTTPNLIAGYWIETEGGNVVVIAEFAEPQPMQTPLQLISIQARLVFPN